MSVSLPQVHTTELARAAGLTKHGVIGRQCSADVGAGPRPPTPTLTWVHKGAVAHLVLGLERAAQHRAGNAARGERARHPEPQLRDRTTGRPSPGEAPRCCCGRQGCLGITHSQHTHTHRSAPTRPPGRLEPQKHHATRIGAHPLDGLDLVSRDKHLRPAQPSPAHLAHTRRARALLRASPPPRTFGNLLLTRSPGVGLGYTRRSSRSCTLSPAAASQPGGAEQRQQQQNDANGWTMQHRVDGCRAKWCNTGSPPPHTHTCCRPPTHPPAFPPALPPPTAHRPPPTAHRPPPSLSQHHPAPMCLSTLVVTALTSRLSCARMCTGYGRQTGRQVGAEDGQAGGWVNGRTAGSEINCWRYREGTASTLSRPSPSRNAAATTACRPPPAPRRPLLPRTGGMRWGCTIWKSFTAISRWPPMIQVMLPAARLRWTRPRTMWLRLCSSRGRARAAAGKQVGSASTAQLST